MTPVPETTTLSASRISVDVRTPADLVVLSVHRRAINLVMPGPHTLLTVADERVGGLPGAILVRQAGAAELDLREIGVAPGMPVRVTEQTCIGGPDGRGALRIDCSGALRWSAGIGRVDPAPWPRRRVQAHRRADDAGAHGGIRDVPGGPARLQALAAAIDRRDARATTEAIRPLIGLGPGLTPSGDDVLTGAAAVLHAVGHPCAGSLAAALDDVDARTTTIGAAMLRYAARGEIAERIHRLLGALLTPTDASDTLEAAIAETVAWGATSGTDLLTGVLLALDAATGAASRAHDRRAAA